MCVLGSISQFFFLSFFMFSGATCSILKAGFDFLALDRGAAGKLVHCSACTLQKNHILSTVRSFRTKPEQLLIVQKKRCPLPGSSFIKSKQQFHLIEILLISRKHQLLCLHSQCVSKHQCFWVMSFVTILSVVCFCTRCHLIY